MSVGLCDRITEHEWVVRGPETERLWVSHVAMGDQGPATGKHSRWWWVGSGSPCHREPEVGVYVQASRFPFIKTGSAK